MYVLGLATMGESAAALLKDGELVAAVEEERFTRVKHEGCFPIRSVEFCLAEGGIPLAAVDHVGVYWQPWRLRTRARGVLGTAVRRPASFWRKLSLSVRELSPAGGGQMSGDSGSWWELFFVRRLLQARFGSFKGEVHYLDHHRCHMASAFFASPFEEATILTFDGAGEEVSTTLAVGKDNQLRILRAIPWPHSLGHFYSAMTGFLGFPMLDGEYKMMGLAPYNTPDFLEFIRRNVLLTDDPGSYKLNHRFLDYHDALQGRFPRRLIEVFGDARRSEGEPFTERHQKVASSAQAAFEEVVFDLARWAFQAGGRKKNLCIAGGCGLNCTANGKLLREGPFDRMYVPPAPHDAGCAVGAALLLYHEVLGQPRKFCMEHAYYGPRFGDRVIEAALKERGLVAQHVLSEEQLVDRVAEALARGQIVAWFQGRAEFGPRALGARSFLADPRCDAVRDKINDKIKRRELFRPFAPSVKEEAASDFFELPQKSPFMNIIAPVRPSRRKQIPAVTHVDGSARVHTVSRLHNPRFWSLLDRFEHRTGVPVLLNTSFNVQEPIVCTPREAVATSLRSEVDALAIGDYYVNRRARSDEAQPQ